MASIRDVAKACGVSTATVSHVLRGRSDKVSEETRQKVLAAVRKLRYKPTAHDPDSRHTRNLGLLIPDITTDPLHTNTYLAGVLNGVLEASALAGYSITIFVERMWDNVGHTIRTAYDGKCDGLLYVAPPQESEVVASLQERGTPIVLVGSTPWLPKVSAVDIDNIVVGAMAARHLGELGHRRVAYLAYEMQLSSSFERYEGFRKGALEQGLTEWGQEIMAQVTPDEGFVRLAPVELARVLAALPEDQRPTGLFCWNDMFALELMRALVELGLNVPGDISIIAVDDSDAAAKAPVPLTTFRQPLRTIGSDATNLLIDAIEHPGRPDRLLRLSAEFVIRESASPPARGGAHPSHDPSVAIHSEPMEVP